MTDSETIQRGLDMEKAVHERHPILLWVLHYAEDQVDSGLSSTEYRENSDWYAGYAAAWRDLTKFPARCIAEKDSALLAEQQRAADEPESPIDDAPEVNAAPQTI